MKAKTVQNDLKTKISTQNAEIDEKNKIISKLEKDLSQQRELTLRHAQEADKEMQQRLQVQKNDYEATIQRHLNFIDQVSDLSLSFLVFTDSNYTLIHLIQVD